MNTDDAESMEQLRELSSRLQSAWDDQRMRIARQLHDGPGQSLAALRMDLTWIAAQLTQVTSAAASEAVERLQECGELVDQAIDEVRRIGTELRPGILSLGLEGALGWQAEEFQARSGIACSVAVSVEDSWWTPAQTTDIYRIFEELLANTARHAGASAVRAEIGEESNEIRIEFNDDGRGIRAEEISSREAYGLLGIRVRVSRLGGTFSIRGAPGLGTTVVILLPGPKLRTC